MTSGKSKSWRDVLPVHPAADLFPMMSADELRVLGKDIKKNGLQNPVTVWYERLSDQTYYLLDGRNRLDAMEAVGIKLIDERGHVDWTKARCNGVEAVDPYAYVISANIHRRHLTTEQKRELISKVIKATPDKSDRQIAEQTKASPTTVGKVRQELEETGDVSKLDTRTDSKGRAQPTHKPKKQINDEELLRNLIMLAHSKRLVTQMGHVQIDSGPEVETPEPLSEHRRKAVEKLWPQLSLNDQQSLTEWAHCHNILPRLGEQGAAQDAEVDPASLSKTLASPSQGLTVTLKEGWSEPLIWSGEYLGVPVAEYVDFLLMLGQVSFNRKFQSGLTSTIEWWLVEMHSKYPDTFNSSSWEGSCGHLAIDKLYSARGIPVGKFQEWEIEQAAAKAAKKTDRCKVLKS